MCVCLRSSVLRVRMGLWHFVTIQYVFGFTSTNDKVQVVLYISVQYIEVEINKVSSTDSAGDVIAAAYGTVLYTTRRVASSRHKKRIGKA